MKKMIVALSLVGLMSIGIQAEEGLDNKGSFNDILLKQFEQDDIELVILSDALNPEKRFEIMQKCAKFARELLIQALKEQQQRLNQQQPAQTIAEIQNANNEPAGQQATTIAQETAAQPSVNQAPENK
jgi:hypothetical protein